MRCSCSAVLGAVLLMCCSSGSLANDPSPGWLAYAEWSAPNGGRITSLNTTWTVPTTPRKLFGSNAPGWWFGVQTAKGDGALIQPILAWGYEGFHWTIFNGVFDWTDASWHTSSEKRRVEPGDVITSSVTMKADQRTYTMQIATAKDPTPITTDYVLESHQVSNESTAYFVLEHAPMRCGAYPPDGVCTFSKIAMEVDGKPIQNPEWKSVQGKASDCSSKATVVDPETIKFTWDASATANYSTPLKNARLSLPPTKWGYGADTGAAPQEKCVAKNPLGPDIKCVSTSPGGGACTKAKDSPGCTCSILVCSDNAQVSCESPNCCACCLESCNEGKWQKVGYNSKKECCQDKPECCPG